MTCRYMQSKNYIGDLHGSGVGVGILPEAYYSILIQIYIKSFIQLHS